MGDLVTVTDLTFTYPGAAAPAVRGLDFSVGEGEIFGLLGPSGAGKSTTQNILIGLLRGYAGDVQVMGRDLAAWGPDYYERVGVSFELPNHFLKLTARENLEYFRALYAGATEPVEAALARFGLEDAIDQRVGAFSKGMKARLNLARSLLHRPRLWFLDEPTGGLDPVNARRVRDVVREMRDGGATVFLTTHNMAVAAELCDRVGFIVDGALAVVDAPAALERRYGKRTVRVELTDGAAHEFPLDGLGTDAAFLELLRTSAPDGIAAIHSQETTLESVFIEVTGRGLR